MSSMNTPSPVRPQLLTHASSLATVTLLPNAASGGLVVPQTPLVQDSGQESRCTRRAATHFPVPNSRSSFLVSPSELDDAVQLGPICRTFLPLPSSPKSFSTLFLFSCSGPLIVSNHGGKFHQRRCLSHEGNESDGSVGGEPSA